MFVAAIAALVVGIVVIAFDQAREAAERVDEYVTAEDPRTGRTAADADLGALQR